MHGFPAALTSFVGREEAVRDVTGLLEEFRLVTVTGPGGMGKTRLVGQVARQVAARFTDGAWLAELAPVRDPAQVAAVVAAALGIQEQPGTPLAGTLAQALAGQQLLLVLDNCEHVLGTAAQLCAGLLTACDDVRVLATSREPLAAAGEARYRLAPLTLPAPDDTADGGRSESVALFADRARRADARFALDEQTSSPSSPSTPSCATTSTASSPRSPYPRLRPPRRRHLPPTSHLPTNSTRRDCGPPGRALPRTSARSTPRSPRPATRPSPPGTPPDSANHATRADPRGLR
jgi:hypothetical protein